MGKFHGNIIQMVYVQKVTFSNKSVGNPWRSEGAIYKCCGIFGGPGESDLDDHWKGELRVVLRHHAQQNMLIRIRAQVNSSRFLRPLSDLI